MDRVFNFAAGPSTMPVWALDILIALLVAALAAVMIFGRG